MFRCKDCGQEYDIKPEYCDCGNNVFEEIITKPAEPNNNKELLNPPTNEYTHEYQRQPLQEQVSPLAVVIFSICIILSLLSIIFIGRDSDNTETQTETTKTVQEKQIQNIPSINSLWDNTPVKQTAEVKTQPVQVQTVVQKPVQTAKPAQTSTKQVKQQVQQTQKTKTTTNQPVKQTATKTVQAQTNKTTKAIQSTQTTQKPAQNTQTTQKTDVSKYIPKQTTTVSQTSQTQTTQSTQTVQPVKTEPKVDTAALQKELLNYKIALRNKIASNIDFVKVVGDGSCQVTFKIDSSGNLVNRNFAVQSPNNTLNDVVYNAMLRNPSYKTPPQGYKNETLTLTVKMYSGNFEVDLR